jgi:ribosomal protein L11 methyltransferase
VPLAALVVDVQGKDAESLSDALLEAGALSVTCEESQPPAEAPDSVDAGESDPWPRVRLTVLCSPEHDPQRLLRRACEASSVPTQNHEVSSVSDEDWVVQSRRQFGPIRVSSRLRIVPSWHRPTEAAAVSLVLDPGLAFGTGSHESTRLCLRWLERRIRGGESVLDYGCGSGILAIAALKLGASRAVGIDIDPDAVAAAKANAKRNGVAGEFRKNCSSLSFTADIVVANILANTLNVLAPLLASRCKRGGHIALSGILAEQADDVERSYARWVAFGPPDEEGGWVLRSGVKR